MTVAADGEVGTTEPLFGLIWGVKRSFRDYIAGMADGSRRVSGGARETADGRFFFPIADALPGAGLPDSGLLRFRGRVEFGGHAGMLRVGVSDPWLQIDGSHIGMSVADGDLDDRLDLAEHRGSVAANVVTSGVQFTLPHLVLRESGAALFAGVYSAGEPLDEALVQWPGGL